MILKVYCFFDRVSQSFSPQLMLMPNDEVFKRCLKLLVNNPQFPQKDLVEDLQAYCLGSMDQEAGTISADKQFICNLVDFKEVKSV